MKLLVKDHLPVVVTGTRTVCHPLEVRLFVKLKCETSKDGVKKVYQWPHVNWRKFIECFKATTHKNIQISSTEKMNYMISYLEGEAKASIKGLKLCHDNYEVAKDSLEERFGNKHTLISCHLNKLLSLNNVYDSTDIKGLRNFFDTIQIKVCSLNILGYDYYIYGPMLIFFLLSKLPTH